MPTRRWPLLLGLGPLLLATVAAADSAEFVRVKVETLNVRERPTTRSERLWQAYRNDPLQLVTERGRWLKVRDFEGYEGWVYAPLTDDRPSVIVKVPTANMRSGPGTNHPVVYTAPFGTAFLVRKDRGRWLEVQHEDGARGWMHESLVWGDY